MFCVIHTNYVLSICIEQGQKGDIGPPGPPGLVSFSLKSSFPKFNIASSFFMQVIYYLPFPHRT